MSKFHHFLKSASCSEFKLVLFVRIVQLEGLLRFVPGVQSGLILRDQLVGSRLQDSDHFLLKLYPKAF